jgi:hypothetical protein
MPSEIELFIEEVRGVYRPILLGEAARIRRGNVLWNQFEAIVTACETSPDVNQRQLIEKINEMTVAKILTEDAALTGVIEYEPGLLANNRRIDFVAERANDNLYIEVKTVHPRTVDDDNAWQNYLRRRQHHPGNVHFVVQQNALGGAIYGNTFSSRSRFLQYALDFEDRLASAKQIRNGVGVLVFCGDGFAWRLSDLEDFADYYHSGQHRADDPFARMEQHHIEETGLNIRRNIDHLVYVKRYIERPDREELRFPVRGPIAGR